MTSSLPIQDYATSFYCFSTNLQNILCFGQPTFPPVRAGFSSKWIITICLIIFTVLVIYFDKSTLGLEEKGFKDLLT